MTTTNDHTNQIRGHYERHWHVSGTLHSWDYGPRKDDFPNLKILELPPLGKRKTWVYATCGMSMYQRFHDIELHMHSPRQFMEHAETLIAIAHYHLTEAVLGLGHTVNIGKPWMPGSKCDRGLISLPYLDGPDLEKGRLDNGWAARCLWLIPITESEVKFKASNGLNELEKLFEKKLLDYANPNRQPVI